MKRLEAQFSCVFFLCWFFGSCKFRVLSFFFIILCLTHAVDGSNLSKHQQYPIIIRRNRPGTHSGEEKSFEFRALQSRHSWGNKRKRKVCKTLSVASTFRTWILKALNAPQRRWLIAFLHLSEWGRRRRFLSAKFMLCVFYKPRCKESWVFNVQAFHVKWRQKLLKAISCNVCYIYSFQILTSNIQHIFFLLLSDFFSSFSVPHFCIKDWSEGRKKSSIVGLISNLVEATSTMTSSKYMFLNEWGEHFFMRSECGLIKATWTLPSRHVKKRSHVNMEGKKGLLFAKAETMVRCVLSEFNGFWCINCFS